MITFTPRQRERLKIILSVSQRRQLLALFLLTRGEPVILAQLEQVSCVLRMTILKDLNEVEAEWLNQQQPAFIWLDMARPNSAPKTVSQVQLMLNSPMKGNSKLGDWPNG